MKWVDVSVIECSQPKGVKQKVRERKLKSGANAQRTLKQKGVIQGLRVIRHWRAKNLVILKKPPKNQTCFK
jgi:hypothetical protein